GHDMSNLIMPVRVRLAAIERTLGPNGADDVAAIRQCVDQLQHLAAGLRMLTGDPRKDLVGEKTDLGSWAKDVTPLFRNVLPKETKLELRLGQGLPPVAVARHSLTQAVFNLVQNAADALRERSGGVLIIGAEAHDSAVELSVQDNGPGMSEEV